MLSFCLLCLAFAFVWENVSVFVSTLILMKHPTLLLIAVHYFGYRFAVPTYVCENYQWCLRDGGDARSYEFVFRICWVLCDLKRSFFRW